MAKESINKQASRLEKKIRELAELLTMRKIDWTNHIDSNKVIIEFLKRKNAKSYFTFDFEKREAVGNRLYTFVIKVTAGNNVGEMFFEILNNGQVLTNYISGKSSMYLFFQFPEKVFDRIYHLSDTSVETLLANLTTEIKEQNTVVGLLSK